MSRQYVIDPRQSVPQFHPPPQKILVQPVYNGATGSANGNGHIPYPTQQIQQAGSSRHRSRSHSQDPTGRTRVSSNTLHPPSTGLGHHRSSSFPDTYPSAPGIRPRKHSQTSFLPPHHHHHQGTSYVPAPGVQIAHSAPQGSSPIVRDYAFPQSNTHDRGQQRTQSFSGYTTQLPPGTYTPVQVPNHLLAPYMPGVAHSSPGGVYSSHLSPGDVPHQRGRTTSNPYHPQTSSSNQGVSGTIPAVTKKVRYSPTIQDITAAAINQHPSHRYPSNVINAPQMSYRAPGVSGEQGDPRAFHTGISEIDKYLQLLPPSKNFCWSKCTGRKKAVCVGINYSGQKDELKGCANDARHMRNFLIKYHGFRKSDIMLLTDEQGGIDPTRKNIFDALHWLTRSARKDDSLFFHYSGHGGQVPDKTGQEKDGLNEAIFPVDFKKTGEIIDDDLHKYLVQPLPPGCRLTAVFDSCHSGTVLDLPYLHSAHGRLRGLDHISHRARSRGAPAADVICFASCKDDETSADTFHGGIAVGAMSYAFIKVLKEHPKMNYGDLLSYLRKTLIPKYHQKAQLSTTHPLDLDKDFVL